MRTRTLQQTVTFKASPHQVYNILEASVAVRRARKNQPQGGRKIHSLGIAHIWNQPGAEARQKIVQAWRATGWWSDHYSIAIYDIAKIPGGSKLKFTQIGPA